MMSAIRAELNMLDAKISEFQQIADASGNEPEPIDLSSVEFLEVIADPAPVSEPISEPVIESVDEPTLEDLQEEEVEVAEVEPEAEPESELVTEPEAEQEDDDLPFFDEPELILTQEKVQQEVVEENPAAAVGADVENLAWWKDEPASAVKDVRSAISLNDRIVFINKLFSEDPIAFQTAIGKINAMASLSEVVEYISTECPGWNLESDVVYRFMMAVRRKVR